ncbi:restriction endonuclease subunit S [Sphaerotilus sp.]|uniref:restriction endonuclease subunit S n=1 Tax=Sphaerotilus sp. TaxID=2093942 RepID=UPI002ACE0D58|nr:restriction endonuclease subunit S [Sphaerotilus sp.]MDZ7858665.1 restriction endonuclease subunit S [Sphaerotilus sp.]
MTNVGAVLKAIISGKSVKTLERPVSGTEFGILKVSAVTWGEFRPNENKAMPPEYDPGDCPRAMNGDILISRANTRELVGAPVMVKGDHPHLLLSDKLLKLIPDESVISRRYLVLALRSPAAKQHFSQCAGGSSGSMTNITQSDIRSTPIPLPLLTEQRRIAAILDQADALRAKRREALAELEGLAQAIFVEMFGDPHKNPKGWDCLPIEEIANVVTGNTPPRDRPEYYGFDIDWIKSDNINNPSYYLTRSSEKLSELGKKVGRVVPAGSVLVTCIAGSPECIGNSGMANREVAFNQQINALVPKTIDPHFLYGLVRASKKLIQAASTNGMKGMVSKSKLEAVRLIVPPMDLQKSFSIRTQALESLKATHRAALTELDALFASLQHRAFRGEL